MINKFKKRRDYMIKLLKNDLPEVKCQVPGGAFYAFPNFGYYMGKSFDGKTN